ncbi:hypothetical protein HDV02_005726, partial [Globomyces sp. JEL0801]
EKQNYKRIHEFIKESLAYKISKLYTVTYDSFDFTKSSKLIRANQHYDTNYLYDQDDFITEKDYTIMEKLTTRNKGKEILVTWLGFPVNEASWIETKNCQHEPLVKRSQHKNKKRWLKKKDKILKNFK